MRYFFCFIVSLCFSECLFSQTIENLETKSFYYDVNNYSLTPESMLLLAEFVEEIKLSPIEIVEIIGYVEKHGSETYNKIKSKRRMNTLKGVIDSAIVIHQYKPENIDYPPSFLYSYSDGYNWRRVDITFRKITERLSLIIPNNQNINNTIQIRDKIKETDKIIEEIEIEKLNKDIIILDTTQKDLNLYLKPDETGKISTIGKSQEDIDKMVIREKSRESNGNRKTVHPEIGLRLSKIDVSNMDNTRHAILHM